MQHLVDRDIWRFLEHCQAAVQDAFCTMKQLCFVMIDVGSPLLDKAMVSRL